MEIKPRQLILEHEEIKEYQKLRDNFEKLTLEEEKRVEAFVILNKKINYFIAGVVLTTMLWLVAWKFW